MGQMAMRLGRSLAWGWVAETMSLTPRSSANDVRSLSSSAQTSAGGQDGCGAGVDGVDNFAVVDALEIDGNDAEVGVAKLALDDVERHAFARHLDGVGMSKLMWGKAPPNTGANGEPSQSGPAG